MPSKVTVAHHKSEISHYVDDPLSTPEANQALAGYYQLLSQIDNRLMKEDPEYRNKYYPEKGNENLRNTDHTS